MPLPTGTWTLNHSGNVDSLAISAVDVSGGVTGILNAFNAASPILGLWDEALQRLTFQVSVVVGPVKQTFVFTGYLFQDTISITGLTGSTIFTLAGNLAGVQPTLGITAQKPMSGWYAQIGVD